MKKLLAILFVASVGLALVGCKSGGDSSTDSSAAPKTGIKDKTPTGGDAD